MKKIPETTQKMLEALQKTAAETLDKKRRLGQYAVVWKDGQPVLMGEDAPDIDGLHIKTNQS